MDRSRCKSKRDGKGKKSPRVPIKTYRWEDVRRARKRGGYPWTHLYKDPFADEVDPEEFTMDALRRSKSSSTMGRSEGVDILEISTNESGVTDVSMTHLEIVTDPDDHVMVNNRHSSLVIEELTPEEETPSKDVVESAESSDNISQYLDQEDRGADKQDTNPEGPSRDLRAKSEEAGKRKRKLSADSSYSRISLSKLAVMKRLREVKDKIKLPKVSFPTRRGLKNKSSPPKETKKKPSPTADKKTKVKPQEKKETKPEYIYIPLKPPEGETEEKSQSQKPPLKINPAFKQLLKDIKKLKEKEELAKAEETKDQSQSKFKVEKVSDEEHLLQTAEAVTNEPKQDEVRSEEELNLEEAEMDAEPMDEDKSESPKKIEPMVLDKPEAADEEKPEDSKEVDKLEPADEDKSEDIKELDKPDAAAEEKPEGSKEVDKFEPADEDKSEDIKEVDNLEAEDSKGVDKPEAADKLEDTKEEELTEDEGAKNEVFERLFEAQSSRAEAREVRSKSAEPERKRRNSIESAHSRKSLSKLGIMKKLREASEKIKASLSLSSLKKEDPKKKRSKSTSVVKLTKQEPTKPVEPVYIHIPLKPPEGQTDEFSHLEFEPGSSASAAVPSSPVHETEESSPVSPANNDIQFIFLTPPSDDEVLDDKISEIPETPSSDDIKFFSSLKKLAQNVVDEIADSSLEKHTLETVAEESISDKSSNGEFDKTEEEQQENLEPTGETSESKKMLVDVEDGLNETPAKTEELKSSLKSDTASPVMRKKVSFKRKLKVVKDDDYEEVQPPKDSSEVTQVVNMSQSMSVDEEKSYLDQKIVKDTSLEEDYNKWSKQSDHEYEPVNPPEEVTLGVPSVLPTVKIVDTEIDPGPRVVFSATEVLDTSGPFEEKRTPMFHFHSDEHLDNGHEEAHSAPEKAPQSPGKFQLALKQKTDQLKQKTDQLKQKTGQLTTRIRNVKRPDFKRLKIERPKMNLPKMPDTVKINLPFSLPRRSTKPTLKETRQFSTESNASDSMKRPMFGFGTFPKFMRKKQKEELSDFATMPKQKRNDAKGTVESESWSAGGSVRIPLHSEDSMDADETLEVDEDLDKTSSRIRYDQNIDIDDDYERENQEINMAEHLNRWQHGRFNPELEELQKNKEPVTDLDNLDDEAKSQSKDGYSSEGSESLQRRGILGKIDVDSDEFFVVHEIHEGMRTPANALAQMNEYDPILPDQGKRKPIKKPKRKKTPHVSQEELPPDESLEELSVGLPPSRPNRRSKKRSKPKAAGDDVIPYQETIALESEVPSNPRLEFPRESLGILGDDEREEADYDLTYENEEMEGKEQPEILITDPYRRFQFMQEERVPEAPPRRHRSLKSLTASENDSFLDLGKYAEDENGFDIRHVEECIITEPEMPPRRPGRRSRSHTSTASLPPSSRDEDSILGMESYTTEGQVPCVEEPCVQGFRDYMGYAVVDKHQGRYREPPLPPPRTLPRRKKREIQPDEKFATVPRNVGSEIKNEPPVRPLRNYSTLVQVKSTRAEEDFYQNENKENVDVPPYVEIEDELCRDLQSGLVIQKMRQRPLPAPPRPPRKPRTFRTTLKDITSKENVMPEVVQEETVSTQTDPLPDDFVCEEVSIQQSDRVIEPSQIVKELITPTHYTHGTLLVEPLNGAKILPESQLIRERVIPITREESGGEEVSEIPEEFKDLKNPEIKEVVQPQVQVLKTEKLQVSDLDVDRLRVNELLAGKIVVSEIDTESIRANDVQSQSGFVNLSEMGLSPELVKEIVKGLMKLEQQSEVPSPSEEKKTPIDPNNQLSPSPVDLSKTPVEESHLLLEEFQPEPPPRLFQEEDAPQRPPRFTGRSRKGSKDSEGSVLDQRGEMLEPEVDDEPPPRPPEPLEGRYVPSQPPASFYALRAQKYVADLDENIPMVPRRKRHHHQRSRPMSRSKSTSDESSSSIAAAQRTRRAPHAHDQSISELTGQLVGACGACVNSSIKRLIVHLKENVLSNADGQQDLHVCMIILLVLIAGLVLLGYGDEKTVVHLHHWEYFNPPRDL